MDFLVRQLLIYAVPLMLVALAGVYAERSGIINLALEGIMIFGAFMGVLFVYKVQEMGWFQEAFNTVDGVLAQSRSEIKNLVVPNFGPDAVKALLSLQGFELLAMLFAALCGGIFALLLAFAAINLKADQTIGGTALNLLAPALVLFFIRIIAQQNYLKMSGDAPDWFMLKKTMFGYAKNGEIGFFGSAFLDKVYIATYVCIILFIIMSIILYKTRFGMRMRSCGENPQASASLGINVVKMRYAGTVISGALAGMGGFVYALTTANCSSTGEVAGFGFLALAVMIFGNWKPLNICGAAMLFGLFKCVAASYSTLDINGDGIYWLDTLGINISVYRMLPYVITLIVLSFTSKSSRAPKAEGIPYDPGKR
ncbi:MAG: ABC transporter permease [Clostridia bacterium]|nr:ABC transporter permease [Clostridia bacterium]